MRMDGPVISLRGPCNHLVAKLAPWAGVIERKCPQCSKREGRPVFHYWTTETGRLLSDAEIAARDKQE